MLVGVVAQGQVGAAIPPVHGAVLAGPKVDLPEGLKGKVGVLVMGFSQGSRSQVTIWGKRLALDYYQSPQVSYYEMAMVASIPHIMRRLVLRKMKGDVSERGQTTFLPVEDHEKEWKAVTSYRAEDDAYVLVVDGGGVVRWRTQGDLNEAGYAELKQQVKALKQ